MPNTRGLGYKPNKPHERARKVSVSATPLLKAIALPGSVTDLETLVDLRDQTITSSCVGQADQQSAYVGLWRRGVKCKRLSAFSIYTPARRMEVGREGKILDEGCRPAQAIDAIRVAGIATEDAWPFDEAMVNTDLPLDVLEDANAMLPYTIDGEYAVFESGESRATPIMHALSQGHVVAFGTDVDQAFMDHVGTKVLDRAAGPILGGHMMCIVGYETLPSGVVVFRVCNSWGRSWGDGGFFNASIDFIADPRLDDISVFTMQEKS